MRKMILSSLVLNVLVLLPVCTGLLLGMPWTDDAFGPASPARGILLAVYLAIAAVSVLLLFHRQPLLVAPLLLVQVVYKLATPFTVGTLDNPVVLSNLAIALVHGATLVLIARATLPIAGNVRTATPMPAAPVETAR